MADIAEEYRSSLSELNFNSKPHINMLTMLAEENAAHAVVIVKTIVDHINSVTPDVKLPSLYLVDSIVKNIGKVYTPLFSKHLVSLFTSVFEKVDENIRSLLYKLRSTWTGIFPNPVLLQLDRSIVCLDPAWPILAKPQIHFNPKFLKEKAPVQLPQKEESVPQNALSQEVEMKKRELLLLQALHQKKKELITLQLKAALASPSTADFAKEDAKKIINARDPRLSKKIPASSNESDSTVLQSVVVVPKGNVNKRNEKESITTVSKKIKLDSVSSSKKDLKTKPNSTELEINSKLNTEFNTQNNSDEHVQSQKVDRDKKQTFNSENSSELISELPLKQNMNFIEDTSQTDVNSLSQKSNELIKNNFVPKTSVTEENKYLFKSQPVMMTNEDTCHKNIQKLDPPPPPPSLFLGNEDKDYRILPKTVNERSVNESAYAERPPVPVVKSFILDKKERKVYFVNDRSFAFMDDNIPKELTFEGPPKLVFIEGHPQPIELAFGQEVKFDTDGKCNFMKFGTPSREIYINDYPYEAQFGGPSFTTMLSDGKIHRIHISGPPPHVVLTESPAYELYEKFCYNNKEFLRRFDNEPSINNDNLSTDVPVGTRDIDMRVNSTKFSSTFFSFPLEKMQDVDWQRIHVDNMQQTEWNVPKNSFESFKDIDSNFITSRNFPKCHKWENSFQLSEMQGMPINPPSLPPKQVIINRFPLPPPGYRNVDVNKPLISMNQFPMNGHPRLLPPSCMEESRFTTSNVERPRFLPPSNVPFSQPSICNSEISMNRPDLNMVINSNIPRLSPPPLPPFIGPTQNTSGRTMILPATTSSSFNNSVSSVQLHIPPVSAPLLNLPSLQPMTRLSAPLPVNSFSSTIQVPTYTVPEIVPKLTSVPSSTAGEAIVATNDMQLFMEKLKAAGLIKSDSGISSTPVSTSIISSESEKKEDKKDEPLKEETIPEITFDSKCLKEYHSGVIAAIYNGSQCATCGMRFKEIQSEQYSRHLDWHFRRNRREKDGAKKPFSRRWFYEIKDWIQFKELEDVDERAPSYFELQANSELIEEVPESICSVSCSECNSENCAVCGEQFQLFWVEEDEEWHLRNAVKYDDQVYHPACYEDFKKVNNPVADSETLFDDSTSSIKPNMEKFNIDAKIKTEVMSVDENIETEVMNIDSVLEEPMDVNDNAMKRDVSHDMKPGKIDIKKKIDEKLDTINLNSKEEDEDTQLAEGSHINDMEIEDNTQLTEDNQIKDIKIEEDTELTDYSQMKDIKIEEDTELIECSQIKDIKIEEDTQLTEVNEIKNIKIEEDTQFTDCQIEDRKIENYIEIEKEEKIEENKIEDAKLAKILIKSHDMIEERNHIESVSTEHTNKSLEINKLSVEDGESKTDTNDDKIKIGTNDNNPKTDTNDNNPKTDTNYDNPKTDTNNDNPKIDTNNDNTKTDTNNDNTKTDTNDDNLKTDTNNDNLKADINNDNPKTNIASSETNSNVSPIDSNKTDEKNQAFSQSEKVPSKYEEEFEDVEFQPPTPDPRFEVLPPVFKGTEISNLCTIM